MFITVKSREKRQNADMDAMRGTGMIISADGYILTAGHLFPENIGTVLRIEVTTENEPANPKFAEIIYVDRQDDLALIQIKGNRSWPVLCFGNSAALRPDDALYALGYTDDELPILTSTRGQLTNKSGRRWQTNLALNPGNSGAPVFNSSGRVVGVVAGGRPGRELMTFIVPEQYSRGMRDRAGSKECPTVKSTAVGPERDVPPGSETSDDGPILVPEGGRKRFSVGVGSSVEVTDKSLVLAVRDPDLKRNSAGVKFAGTLDAPGHRPGDRSLPLWWRTLLAVDARREGRGDRLPAEMSMMP